MLTALFALRNAVQPTDGTVQPAAERWLQCRPPSHHQDQTENSTADHHRWSAHTHTHTHRSSSLKHTHAHKHCTENRKQHSVECKPTPYHTKMSYGEQQAHWPEFSYRRATEFSCTALHYRWFFQLQFYLWHQPISGLSITLTLTHSSNCNLPKFYPWLIIAEVSKFHDNPPITFSQTHKQTQVNTSPPSKDAEATNLLNKTSMSNHFHLLSYQKHNGE